MIQHLADVHDAASAFGDAQHEVVVLRPVEAVPKAAQLLDERAPDDAQVARVHLAAQPVDRPVGLEERIELATPFVDLVLVGVDVVDVRVLVDGRRDLGQGAWVEEVVVVEEGDELALGHGQAVVGRGHDPAVLGPVRHAHAAVGVGRFVEDGSDLRRTRRVVDEAQLPVGEGLGAHRCNRLPQHLGGRPEDGGDDREARVGAHGPCRPRSFR